MSNLSSEFARPLLAKGTENSRTESRIAFRSLAPKAPDPTPRPLTIRTQSTPLSKGIFSFRRQPDRCHVCFKHGCRLVSHRYYGTSTRGSNTGLPNLAPASNRSTDAKFLASYAHHMDEYSRPNNTISPKTETSYDLPLPANLNTTGVLKLFNHWFSSQVAENFAIPSPSYLKNDVLHSPLLGLALTDTTLCLSILGVAAAFESTNKGPSKNVTALTFIGQAMEHMRERISENPNFISDTTIAAGALLWAANWFLEDAEAMKQHGQSVCAFVKTRGGIEHLGLSGAIERIVRWADILNSLLLRATCNFSPPLCLIRLPEHGSPSQGLFWAKVDSSDALDLDPSIISGYKNTCRLIALIEHLDNSEPGSRLHFHTYQHVEALFIRNSSLQEKHQDRGNLNQCLTLALFMIKIRFFWHIRRQHILLLKSNAILLVKAIKAAGRPSFWQKNLDILIWLLFVTELSEADFQERDWVRQILAESLETKFGDVDDWEADWRGSLVQDLLLFGWPQGRFRGIYTKTCNILVKGLREMDVG